MDTEELLSCGLITARNHVGFRADVNQPALFDLLQALHDWPKVDEANVLSAIRKLNASPENNGI